MAEAIRAFRRDLNVVMSRGVWRIFGVALSQYQRTLEAHALLDFSGVLERAIHLLQGMDEFAQSRFRLEARYRHVLVDEFQDTSRVQWELVSQLVRNWGEGFGAAADALPPSIFIVGDRKQSIYGFRDAEVAVLDEAAAFVAGLRADGDVRRAISVSFRAAPALLAFVNDVFDAVEKAEARRDAFRYGDQDRFPVSDSAMPTPRTSRGPGLRAGRSARSWRRASRPPPSAWRTRSGGSSARRWSAIERPGSPGRRAPADVAILFRTRDATRSSRRRWSAKAFRPTSTRASASSTRPRCRTWWRCSATWPIPIRICGPPPSCGPASSACRTAFVAGLAPRIARALLAPEAPGAMPAASDDDRRVLRRSARAAAGVAVAGRSR